MHQKYTVAFSSNTKLVLMVALKFACFSISFSPIFKIIFHNFRTRIVILYLLFVSLNEGTIKLFWEKLVGQWCKELKNLERKTSAFPFLNRCRKRRLLKIFNWQIFNVLFSLKCSCVCANLFWWKVFLIACFCWLWSFFRNVLLVLHQTVFANFRSYLNRVLLYI